MNELDEEAERGEDVNLHAMHSTDGLLATAEEEEEHQWTTEEEFEDDNVARHDN